MKANLYVYQRFFVPITVLGFIDHGGSRHYFYRVERTTEAWKRGDIDHDAGSNITGRASKRGKFGRVAYTIGREALNAIGPYVPPEGGPYRWMHERRTDTLPEAKP